jgi:hypothetical protein
MSDFNIISVIQNLSGAQNEDKIRLLQCTVNSVNLSNRTAHVTTITGQSTLDFDVQLQAGIADGLVIEPAIDSMVYVLTSKYTLPFIVQYSDVVSLSINGVEFGGLVKVIELTNKLNAIENKLNNLLTAYNSHTHIASGTPTSPTNLIESGNLTPTQQSEIENIVIKHGA